MKKGLVLACSAMTIVFAMSSVAEARDGFYLTARGGMTWNNLNSKKDAISESKVSKLDHVGVYSGALGYKYKYLRSELEYVWRADAEEDISTSDSDTKFIIPPPLKRLTFPVEFMLIPPQAASKFKRFNAANV